MGNSLGNGITIQKKVQFFVSNILTRKLVLVSSHLYPWCSKTQAEIFEKIK